MTFYEPLEARVLLSAGPVLAFDGVGQALPASSLVTELLQAAAAPDDLRFAEQWHFQNTGQLDLSDTPGTPGADIRVTDAWDLATGSRDVVVAVLDSGVDLSHPDLAANLWTNPFEVPDDGIDNDGNGFIDDVQGWDFVDDDNTPQDGYFHGTHLAGTIAAVGDNGLGVAGVNWNVTLLPVRMLGNHGNGSISDGTAAINYVTGLRQQGVNVVAINASWGGVSFNQPLGAAIDAAVDAGITFVTVAGNGNDNLDVDPQYPASFANDGILVVTGSDRDDGRPGFASFGQTTVDLAAPAVEILSTTPDALTPAMVGEGLEAGSDFITGTSMAAAQVSGALGLLKARFPQASGEQLRAALRSSVDPLPVFEFITDTGGRLNVANAMADLEVLVNDPPTLADLRVTPGLVAEGQTVTLRGLAGDADAGDLLTLDIDWGDGQTQQVGLGSDPAPLAIEHVYADDPAGPDDVYAVTVTLLDALGLEVTQSAEVQVINHPPVLLPAEHGPPLLDLVEGRAVFPGVLARFTESGFGDADDLTATIDWGDGSQPTEGQIMINAPGGPMMPVEGVVSGGHVYAEAGLYEVQVTLADGDGGVATFSLPAAVRDVVASDERGRLTFIDTNGSTIRARLIGPGAMTAIVPPNGLDAAEVITPDSARLGRLDLIDTTQRSRLIITGQGPRPAIGGLSVGGAIGRIHAPGIAVQGDVDLIDGARSVALGDIVGDHFFAVAPLPEPDTGRARPLRMRVGDVVDTSFDLPGISLLRVDSWQSRTVETFLMAEDIRRLIVAGPFEAGVETYGGEEGQGVGRAFIRGGMDDSQWAVNAIDSLVVRGPVTDWSAEVFGEVGRLRLGAVSDSGLQVSGHIRQLDARGWQGGSITAAGADVLRFRQSRHAAEDATALSADITLTDPDQVLRRLMVVGPWQDASFIGQGDVSVITAHSMSNVTIDLGRGVEPPAFGETSADDFAAQPELSRLFVRGQWGSDQPAILDSTIYAWSLGRAQLRSAEDVQVLSHEVIHLAAGRDRFEPRQVGPGPLQTLDGLTLKVV